MSCAIVSVTAYTTGTTTTDSQGYYALTTVISVGTLCPLIDPYVIVTATGYQQIIMNIALTCGTGTRNFVLSAEPESSPEPSPTPFTSSCTCASGCDTRTVIFVPFSVDGTGKFCYEAASLGSYINSWNVTTLNVNGTNYTNTWVSAYTINPASDGKYYIYYSASVSWAHFETKN